MNYSWARVLNSYLMIAVLGPLCTSRLSPPSSPLMNEKQEERGRERESQNFPLVAPKMSFPLWRLRNCTIDTNPKSHSRTSECMMYGLLHFLVRWPTTLNTHLQHTTKQPSCKWHRAEYTHTLSGLRGVWKMGFMLPPPAQPKSLLSRLKPRHTELLHTTAGPDSFQSAAHFSPHFLYIIHTIKHIKFNACRCTVPYS